MRWPATRHRAEGPYRVTDALDDYFKSYAKRGKGVSAALSATNLHIRPALGALPVAKLTTKRLRDWHHAIADKPRQARGKRGEPPKDAKQRTAGRDAIRKRRATANRVLTVLKAALNHAWREGIVPSDDAWRRVSPFKGVDAPVIRYLSREDECAVLSTPARADFRDLVRGALLTGCRYGELIALRAADYNADAGTVTVRESKAGKVRHVVLTDEGRTLFDALTAGRARDTRHIPSQRRQAVGGLASATAACRGMRPCPDFPGRQLPYSPPFARINTRHARRADGRHRRATWARRHANDREALRAPGTVLRRRHHPRPFSDAWNWRGHDRGSD